MNHFNFFLIFLNKTFFYLQKTKIVAKIQNKKKDKEQEQKEKEEGGD